MKKILSLLCVGMMVLVVCGIFLYVFSCDGSCGSSSHGGMLDYVHNGLYLSSAVRTLIIVLTVVGGLIAVVSASLILVSKFRRNKVETEKKMKIFQ